MTRITQPSADPVEMRPHELEDRINNTRAPGRALVAYSRQGPFRYELIEFVGDGLYAPSQGEGLHHLGVWEPGLSSDSPKWSAQVPRSKLCSGHQTAACRRSTLRRSRVTGCGWNT